MIVARGIARGVARGVARGLSGSGKALDPDAVAWIDAVIAAGGTLFDTESATKKLASDYFTALKTDSTGNLHALLARDYHPVWQVAAANAICAKSLTSGTFVGTVTHGVGFVQGDGSTGVFLTAFNLNSVTTVNDATFMTSLLLGSTLSPRDHFGSGLTVGTSIRMGVSLSTTTISGRYLGADVTSSSTNPVGINMLTRRSGITTYSTLAGSSLTEDTNSSALTGTFVNLNFCLLARGETAAGASNARLNAASIGLSMSASQRIKYALARRQFYESLTGISLP